MAVVGGSFPGGAAGGGFAARGRCSGMARVGGSCDAGVAVPAPPARRSPSHDSISRLPEALLPRPEFGGLPAPLGGAPFGAENRVV